MGMMSRRILPSELDRKWVAKKARTLDFHVRWGNPDGLEGFGG